MGMDACLALANLNIRTPIFIFLHCKLSSGSFCGSCACMHASMHRPYLLQHVHRVPAALHPGGEAGRGRGIVILCRLREELGHRYLIRHPSTAGRGGDAHGRVCDECSERQNHVRLESGGKAAGDWSPDGRKSRFSPQKLSKCSVRVFFPGGSSNDFTIPQRPWEEGIV